MSAALSQRPLLLARCGAAWSGLGQKAGASGDNGNLQAQVRT